MFFRFIYLILIFQRVSVCISINIFHYSNDRLDKKFLELPSRERLKLKNAVKDIFYFAFDSYLKYAYPYDELDPVHCTGRGPDYENP